MNTINEIIQALPVKQFTGNGQALITKVVELKEIGVTENAICWCSPKNLDQLENIHSGTVISPELPAGFEKKPGVNYLETENPRLYFKNLLQWLFPTEQEYSIAASAKIAPGVKLGNPVSIGENVVIEAGCIIGHHTRIGHNTVLFKNTIVGDHVSIGCNNTIGGAGFGYEKNEEEQYEMLPHVGNVVLENNVETGQNVCIDRAVLSSTRIGRNVKIDNLTHIAHNVVVGENTLVMANCIVAGSVSIGRNVWVAPGTCVLNKIKIGDHAFVGISSVVIQDVQDGESVFGNPARKVPSKKS